MKLRAVALLVLLVFLPLGVLSQFAKLFDLYEDTNHYDRELSMHEFLAEIEASTEERVVFSNVHIGNKEHQGDSKYKRGYYYQINTDKVIYLRGCRISCSLSNSSFKDFFMLESKPNNGMTLDSCTFESLRIFGEGLWGSYLSIRNSTINDAIVLDQSFERVEMIDNSFKKRQDSKLLYNLEMNYWNFEDVLISGCTFQSMKDTTFTSINLSNGKFDALRLSNCVINSIDLSDSDIDKAFIIDSTDIQEYVLVNTLGVNEEQTNIPWFELEGFKLKLKEKINWRDYNTYGAETDEELSNIYQYNELISIYNRFFKMYQERGDRESANGCYIEMKELETRKYEYNYRINGGLSNWFDWKLNVFLKVFSDYGTNPVRSLIISIYVVICFAGLYFFFYSEWDKINRTFLIKQHEKILSYFRSEQRMEDFYTEKYKSDFQTYTEYKKQLEESKVEVPFFISLLGKPLYHISLFRHRVVAFLYRRTEILHGKWIELSKGQRILRGFVISLAVIVYMIYLFSVRAMNSIVLSINTFSTLGFGEIPVKGLSRYIAVLEGFLGWFLLSIFSVSLISQILQS